MQALQMVVLKKICYYFFISLFNSFILTYYKGREIQRLRHKQKQRVFFNLLIIPQMPSKAGLGQAKARKLKLSLVLPCEEGLSQHVLLPECPATGIGIGTQPGTQTQHYIMGCWCRRWCLEHCATFLHLSLYHC